MMRFAFSSSFFFWSKQGEEDGCCIIVSIHCFRFGTKVICRIRCRFIVSIHRVRFGTIFTCPMVIGCCVDLIGSG